MINIVLLIASAAVLACMVIVRPDLLTDNLFLADFVSQTSLSLFVVMLTVTVASVANIHLSINRILAERFRDNLGQAQEISGRITAELRQNCWIIFGGFIATFLLLTVKGALPAAEVAVAVVNASVIWILIVYLVVMLDVYRVAFGFAAMAAPTGGDERQILPE